MAKTRYYRYKLGPEVTNSTMSCSRGLCAPFSGLVFHPWHTQKSTSNEPGLIPEYNGVCLKEQNPPKKEIQIISIEVLVQVIIPHN